MSWRRVATLIAAATITFVVGGGISVPHGLAASASQPFTFNWSGNPAKPLSVVPATWDTQIHTRSVGNAMEPMQAQHGADCAAPPATHPINTLAQGVFICKDHLMTAITDSGYGEIALTSDHMADWSTGTVTIQISVSTLQLNPSDWIEVWVSPYSENLTLPCPSNCPDLQGLPKEGLRFSLNHAELLGTYAGDVSRVDNFNEASLPKARNDDLASAVPPSAAVRTTYQMDISTGHVRFGLPSQNLWWTDTNIAALPFSQGVVQLVHHSYNPDKHCPGCGTDTWHWSNVYISNAVPFTILNSVERSINARGATTAHFPAPAPANANLRFSGIGPQRATYQVSYDGGVSWVSPVLQAQKGTADEHFSTYWTPIPVGTVTVMFRGKEWWGGPWWVRDPAIWSSALVLTPPGPFHALTPQRILDTRTSVGGHLGRLGPEGTMTVQIAGQGGVPSTGLSAVVMNVTVTNTTAAGFMTIYPTGVPQPLASNLNWVAGQTVANLVEVAVGPDGQVAAFNGAGSADVIFDVAGYVSVPSGTPGTDGLYNPVVPSRVLDTRNGNGGYTVPVGPGQTINVQVGGRGGVPGSGVSAVVLNLTATGATAPSYLIAYPTGTMPPLASNLNFPAGQTVANRVIVKVGTDPITSTGGWVSIYNGSGSVNVVADVGGWFTDGTDLTATGALFTGMTPTRMIDTRNARGPVGPGDTLVLPVAGLSGVPLTATAVVLNVTVTGPSAASYLTVWPDGTTVPLASDLNFRAGQTVPNLVVVKLGSGSAIDIYNGAGSTDVVVDIVGWYE